MIRLFVETTHHPAFRYGGWGIARDIAGAVMGQAGGERNVSAERLDLLALAAALEGLLPGNVAVHTASPGIASAVGILVTPPAPEDAPTEDLDLWARLQSLAAGRNLRCIAGSRARGAPGEFLHSWAEVGQDKAKGVRRFSAAIPKPNMAKLALPQ